MITQLTPITAVFTIPEDNVPEVMAKLNAGQQLTVEAFDRSASPQDMAAEKKKLASGTLLTSDNQIDPSTGTLKLKASFANEDNVLWPGLSVSTRLLLTTLTLRASIDTMFGDLAGMFILSMLVSAFMAYKIAG